jgi:hypothetical protein
MKKLTLLLFLFLSTSTCFAGNLVHPLDFNGSEVEKERVLSYIQHDVKETYSAIGMGDPSTLRMMESEELNSFKQLTKVNNRKLLDNVINKYCSIGMCNYSTILMMYKEQESASNKKLQ